MSENKAPNPFVIDQILVLCKGCQSERLINLKTPIRSADALIQWSKTDLPGCECGATHCDLRCHIADQN
jgi:hypothetical protein